ncbi:hypothetical protein MASR2M15_15100 [Anaerolineales bacterium]
MMFIKESNLFLIHALNLEFLQKKRKSAQILGPMRNFISILLIIVPLIMVLIGFAMLSSTLEQFRILTLERDTLSGYIVDKSMPNADSAEKILTYEYQIGNERYLGASLADKAFYDQTHIGDPIQIIYSPQNPAIHVLKWEPEKVYLGGLAGIIILALVVFFDIFLIRRMYRVHQLAKKGQTIKGRLSAVEKYPGDEDDIELHLFYNFISPLSQQEIRGKQISYIEEGDLIPLVDTNVAVIFLDEKNYHLL